MGLSLAVEALAVEVDGRRLLSVPHFAAAAGACVGIRGPSGAGKSTFLYAISGLLERPAGTVMWGRTELFALSPNRRARFRRDNVGLVFQDFMLFEELGAAANAALGAAFAPRAAREAIRARSRERLADLGVPLGPRAVRTYSGGERQRIALARALAADPGVILADEPTASLDAEAKTHLIADFVSAVRHGGKTLIAVSHDPALLEAMDRVFTIADGEIVDVSDA